jgi:predicted RNA methylase
MTDTLTKKRLGQYFSGNKVAGLLARLCSVTGDEYVIDPMAGVGDMLATTIELGVQRKNISGIEIDPDAGSQCKKRIGSRNVHIGDAFSPDSYLDFGDMAWDLVITNPPYVRYQSMSGFEKDGVSLKSAKETRQSLSKLVEEISHLNSNEKACFQRIIQNYSGLSDLAVPAWILCAALTRIGGRIAIVAPESWISRDYALSIRYMLLKFFDMEYIVEDSNSVWFPDALVKTNLLVAKRVPCRKSFDDIRKSVYKHIRLGAGLIGESSLVEKLAVDGKIGYAALDNILGSAQDVLEEGFEVRSIHLDTFLSEMSTSQSYDKLLRKLEPDLKIQTQPSLPVELLEVMGDGITSTALVDLGSWGFQVGQGLRTGANKFFYTELEKNDGDTDYLITDKLFNNKVIPVAQKYSLPVFRYQADASGVFAITKSMLSHRLLYIQEEFFDAGGHLRDNGDAPLEKHIAEADKTPIEINGRATYFSELSAVRPNVRKSGISGESLRHWFMLPPLTDRHLPQLCISRVNYKNARCFLVADKKIVVDANFSTLWIGTQDKERVYAMFSLLNSTWVQSYLETISTIMGGGALKVEASHIRKLLLPYPTNELVASLSRLGERLANGDLEEIEYCLLEINHEVLQSLLDGSGSQKKCSALRAYLRSKVDGRQR